MATIPLLKAIIVDDEEKNIETLESMLKTFCPEVELKESVNSVDGAITTITDHKPDIVFLDIEMPGGNGFTLFDTIPHPDFEVIFTTAHEMYAINAIRYSALDYLLKPIDFRELQSAVNRVKAKRVTGGSQPKAVHQQLELLKHNLNQSKLTKIALPTAEGVDIVETGNIIKWSYLSMLLTPFLLLFQNLFQS